ncbi:hypothetical protein [Pseudomonas putida]|uniref:hypothetical protein n=1 Tax=Pseudomonas putida TaxID=303 RepID=UPI00300EB6AA
MKFKSVWLGCFGAVVAFLGLNHANGLLSTKAISGSDYVWLTAAYLVVGLLIAILPKVTELTFSNLTLKIAAAEQAAAITLEQLNHALELSFAPALASITEFPGGWASDGPLDDRLSKFFTLAETIKKAGLGSRYAAELSDAARTIAKGQLVVIARYNDEFKLHTPRPTSLPTPTAVRIEACNPKGIASAAVRYKTDERETMRLANEAVDAYAKIYSYAS